MKKEIVFFFLIGLTAIIILQFISFLGKGVNFVDKIITSAHSLQETVRDMKESARSMEINEVFNTLFEMRGKVKEIKEELKNVHIKTFEGFGKIGLINDANLLLDAAEDVLQASEETLKFFTYIKDSLLSLVKNIQTINTSDMKLREEMILDRVLRLLINAESKLIKISKEGQEFSSITQKMLQETRRFQYVIRKLKDIMPLMYRFLGDPHPQRYLILLQNEHEIRATGGFPGSYILLTINDGKISYSFHDIYENDGQYVSAIPAPAGFDAVIDYWYLRDANYYPDFPTSAKLISWFLDQEKGPTVDGVIAIDQNFVKSVLREIQPIYLDDYGVVLHEDNFSFLLSYIVESKLRGDKDPKSIIGDLMEKMIDELGKNYSEKNIMRILSKNIKEKHIVFWFEDEEFQTILDLWGLSNRIKEGKDDYLQIIYSSIGGNKSDAFMEYDVKQTTRIINDKQIINELKIERTHTWGERDDAMYQELSGKLEVENSKELREVLGHGANRSFVRIYVPSGSILLSSDGISDIETVEELGKTVFRFISPRIYPGEKRTITLKYRLPRVPQFNGNVMRYHFQLQKQMGFPCSMFHKKIEVYPNDKIHIQKSWPETLLWNKNHSIRFDMEVCSDEEIEVEMMRKF